MGGSKIYQPVVGRKLRLRKRVQVRPKPLGERFGRHRAARDTSHPFVPKEAAYVVVYEMAHLAVRHHNDRFAMLVGQCLPNWKLVRQMLNRAPLAHADWTD